MTLFGRRSLLGVRRAWFVPVLLACLGSGSGCAGMQRRIEICPLAIDEQQAELLRIVPIGTSRDLAARRLGELGIDFTPSSGSSPSTYYVDTWHQVDGPIWAMDVALLFDPEGKLYAVRRRNMSLESENVGLPGSAAAGTTTSNQATQRLVDSAGREQTPRNAATPADPKTVRGRGGWQPAGSSAAVSGRNSTSDEEPL